MIYFTGSFLTNFYLTDFIGIGKQLAKGILPELENDEPVSDYDSSTNGLINMYKRMREEK